MTILNSTISSARQIYDAEGYFVARGMLPLSLIDSCLMDLNEVFADQLKVCNLPAVPNFLEMALLLHNAELEQFKKTLGALWRLQSVSDIFAHESIREFLKDVLGFRKIFLPGGQTVHVQSEELRIPGGYFGLKAHQDWPSVQGSLDGAAVWVPLCDIDESSFPLEVIPGSHCRGLIEPAGRKTGDIWIVDYFDDAVYKQVCVQRGDVVFFSNFTIHRSGLRGRKNFVRLACSSRFDNGNEVTFAERGYPSAYKRTVNRELMNFGNVDAVNQQLFKLKHEDAEPSLERHEHQR